MFLKYICKTMEQDHLISNPNDVVDNHDFNTCQNAVAVGTFNLPKDF